MQGINLSGGASNAVEFCTGMFHMPQLTQWLDAYRRKDELDRVASDMKDWIDDGAGFADAVTAITDLSFENEDE